MLCVMHVSCAVQEEDGYDGTLLPTDFKQAGQIRDTELARVLVHPLPTGVVLHAVFDSCHSGEGLKREGGSVGLSRASSADRLTLLRTRPL